jgi:hypothetical protein
MEMNLFWKMNAIILTLQVVFGGVAFWLTHDQNIAVGAALAATFLACAEAYMPFEKYIVAAAICALGILTTDAALQVLGAVGAFGFAIAAATESRWSEGRSVVTLFILSLPLGIGVWLGGCILILTSKPART